MESSLHRELKTRYATGGRTEVRIGAYRVDAVAADGEVVEIQSNALGPLRGKLGLLLPEHRVRVVKPVVLSKRLVRRSRDDGPDLSARLSPRRGRLADIFDDLIGLVAVFPHPNLTVEVVGVEIDEIRVAVRRGRAYKVADRRLRSVGESVLLSVPGDLWALLPVLPAGPFTTRELAAVLGTPLPFARRVAYCLLHARATFAVGKQGNRRVYVPAGFPVGGPPHPGATHERT